MGKYQEVLSSTYKSQIDDQRYFISPNGMNDPISEWNATLDAFQKGERVCDYPARFMLFQKYGYKLKKNIKKCSDYNFFRKQTDTKKVWIVFASYYVNNPASAFGHTFLRFQANENKPSDLLDFSLDYSADVSPNESAVLYGLKGIVGLYPATYKLYPYYWKVREYLDGESRDLWEYEVKLTNQQIDFLMAHLWEIRKVYSDYYYFSENCSYHILGLIQTAVPEKKILDPLHKIVVPIDTLFALKDNDLLGKRKFRPSIFSRLEKRWKGLSEKQKDEMTFLMEDNTRILQVRDPKVYDTFIEYYDRENYEALLDDKSPEKKLKNEILSKRSKLPISTEAFDYKKVDPVLGHRSRRFTIGLDTEDKIILQHKSALHQLIDPSKGYGSNFHMDMGEVQLKFKDDIEIQKLSLLRIKAFKPIDKINREFSWDLDTKLEKNLIQENLQGIINFSGGGAIDIGELLVYAGLGLEGRSFKGIFRKGDLGYGPKVSLRYSHERLTSVLEYEHYQFDKIDKPIDKIDFQLGFSLGERWNLFYRLQAIESENLSELSLSFYY